MADKAHWENIYTTKSLDEVSWYQPRPEQSLSLIAKAKLEKDASIIDIGGGDGFLVDHLLELGYSDIHVLDIAQKAIERAQQRLGNQQGVQWYVSDVLDFIPEQQFDVWHDRAAFHFLTDQNDIEQYVNLVHRSVAPQGNVIIGTVSEESPEMCSGLPIRQYNIADLPALFATHFQLAEGH